MCFMSGFNFLNSYFTIILYSDVHYITTSKSIDEVLALQNGNMKSTNKMDGASVQNMNKSLLECYIL